DLQHFKANGLTLQAAAGQDILVDNFTGPSGIGTLTLLAGRTVTFGANGSTFSGGITIGDVPTTQPLDIVFTGNVTAIGQTLTVHAVNTITQSTNSVIRAALLTGSSGGDATFNGANHVNLGAFTISGNSTLTLNSA